MVNRLFKKFIFLSILLLYLAGIAEARLNPLPDATKYIHGLGIDEPLAVEQKGDIYYYHADGLGSIIALTDKRQKIVQSYTYDSFGNLKHHGHKVKQPYTYTAREWDKEIGLYFYRERYYDAMLGIFTTKDPTGFVGGINLYIYTRNPINFKDPNGLDTWSGAGDTIGGFLIFGGTATTYGWLTNWRTGEKCYVEIRSYRIGIGLGGGVSANSLWLLNGPSTGQGLNGASLSFGIEGGLGAYVSGSPAGTLGVTEKAEAAIGSLGAGIGAGFAEYAEYAKTRVISCECKNK